LVFLSATLKGPGTTPREMYVLNYVHPSCGPGMMNVPSLCRGSKGMCNRTLHHREFKISPKFNNLVILSTSSGADALIECPRRCWGRVRIQTVTILQVRFEVLAP